MRHHHIRQSERGASVIGTLFLLALIAGLAFFGYRVWYYASQIKQGKIVNLPQYQAFFTAASNQPTLSSSVVPRDQAETTDNPELGANADAAPVLTIVEFADFGCPFSAAEHAVVRRMMAQYGDKVRFVYRDYPVAALHPDARAAAMAAECAREQGKFWAYHDRLYANHEALGFQDLLRYGQEAGLDAGQFESCVIDERYAAKVDADTAAATALGLRGTPTFFFNGQRIEGAIPEEVFEQIITQLTK